MNFWVRLKSAEEGFCVVLGQHDLVVMANLRHCCNISPDRQASMLCFMPLTVSLLLSVTLPAILSGAGIRKEFLARMKTGADQSPSRNELSPVPLRT